MDKKTPPHGRRHVLLQGNGVALAVKALWDSVIQILAAGATYAGPLIFGRGRGMQEILGKRL